MVMDIIIFHNLFQNTFKSKGRVIDQNVYCIYQNHSNIYIYFKFMELPVKPFSICCDVSPLPISNTIFDTEVY